MRKTVNEYAQHAGISVATVYRYINSGRVEFEKIDGTTYVILDESQAENFSQVDETQRLADENQRLADENCWLKAQIDQKDANADQLMRQLEEKDKQMGEKDAQISQLHQLVAMAQSNQADTLKQLEDAKTQGQRRWWKFWGV